MILRNSFIEEKGGEEAQRLELRRKDRNDSESDRRMLCSQRCCTLSRHQAQLPLPADLQGQEKEGSRKFDDRVLGGKYSSKENSDRGSESAQR